MPALVDTTIRLLSQEPLAGRMPTADLLQLAEILDGAGFASLEVSGGGVFDSAVRRGVESPWERIRALKARTKTPLGMALRGRFLVGSRPVGGDFARRFVASAAESGIDVFRLARPAERRREPARGGRGDHRGRAASSTRASSTAPSTAARRSSCSSRRRSCPSSAPRASCSTTRPGALEAPRAHELVAGARRGERPARRHLLPGRRRERARRRARGRARRRRPDRLRRLPDRAHAPPRLRRGARERARRGSASTAASTSTRSGRRPSSSTSTSAKTP